MCSEKFQKVLKNDFKVLIKFLRNCQQFFISTFLKKKCPTGKSRRIWGMSRAGEAFFAFHCLIFFFGFPFFTFLLTFYCGFCFLGGVFGAFFCGFRFLGGIFGTFFHSFCWTCAPGPFLYHFNYTKPSKWLKIPKNVRLRFCWENLSSKQPSSHTHPPSKNSKWTFHTHRRKTGG